MTVAMKMEIKFERLKQQFGCGYYSVCCRACCPCKLKNKEYDPVIMKQLKQEFDREALKLFG
ncbi:MAG: hypothetical protein ACI4GW_13835 [Lachnospiraceae bacterium]